MNSVKERNQFIEENYETIHRLCCGCARRISRKFSNVPFQDLIGYGFEGVIASVDRGNIHSPTIYAYILKYCYSFTLAGARQMMGMNRVSNNKSNLEPVSTMPYEVLVEPSTIEQYIENAQLEYSDSNLDDLFHFLEIRWFIDTLPNSIEKKILSSLSKHYSVIETANRLNIPVRKIRKIALHIARIYEIALMGEPFKHLLTTYKHTLHFYIYLPNTPQKPAFASRTSLLYRNRRHYIQKDSL